MAKLIRENRLPITGQLIKKEQIMNLFDMIINRDKSVEKAVALAVVEDKLNTN